MCGIETELKRREEWNTLATGLRRMKLKRIRRLPPWELALTVSDGAIQGANEKKNSQLPFRDDAYKPQ